MKPEKVSVTCPKCGHTQLEPPAAYSSVCRNCREHFRLSDIRKARSAEAAKPARDLRRVTCFSCGTGLDVPGSAQSTMCKRCSSHVDLRDYHITSTVSKNFKTKGRFLIDETGCLLNTDSIAGEVILKGKLRGKLAADIFHIYPTSEIKGSFKAGRLIIPAVTTFRWPETIPVNSAEIAGELVANLQATGTVHLKSTARFFGNIHAGGIVVESGAIWVGKGAIGPGLEAPKEEKPRTKEEKPIVRRPAKASAADVPKERPNPSR